MSYESIVEEFPKKEIIDGYTKCWKGLNQYEVRVKKKHRKLFRGDYEQYWFVYGKEKNIHLFESPISDYAYFVCNIKKMKYMTIDKKCIELWNDEKKFKVVFMCEDDKKYFDNFYMKASRNN